MEKLIGKTIKDAKVLGYEGAVLYLLAEDGEEFFIQAYTDPYEDYATLRRSEKRELEADVLGDLLTDVETAEYEAYDIAAQGIRAEKLMLYYRRRITATKPQSGDQ